VQVAASNARKMHRLIAAVRGRALPAGETSARIHSEGSIRIAALQIKKEKSRDFVKSKK